MEQIKYLQFLQHVVIHYLGATYCVMAPEHPYVEEITTEAQKADVESYKESCASKSDLERTELNKDKTGVFTGAYAINPVNGKKKSQFGFLIMYLQVMVQELSWLFQRHDDRDYEFAKKFGIEIIPVLEGERSKKKLIQKMVFISILNG